MGVSGGEAGGGERGVLVGGGGCLVWRRVKKQRGKCGLFIVVLLALCSVAMGLVRGDKKSRGLGRVYVSKGTRVALQRQSHMLPPMYKPDQLYIWLSSGFIPGRALWGINLRRRYGEGYSCCNRVPCVLVCMGVNSPRAQCRTHAHHATFDEAH